MSDITTSELNIMLQNLNTKFDEKFGDMKEILIRIEKHQNEQFTSTDDRLSKLEEKANKAEGSINTFKWLVGAIGIGTLVMFLKFIMHVTF